MWVCACLIYSGCIVESPTVMHMYNGHFTTSPSTYTPVCSVLFSINHRVTSSLPHIVDVDWRLDYYIKVIPGGSLSSLRLSIVMWWLMNAEEE